MQTLDIERKGEGDDIRSHFAHNITLSMSVKEMFKEYIPENKGLILFKKTHAQAAP